MAAFPSNGAADIRINPIFMTNVNQTDHASVDYRLAPGYNCLIAQWMLLLEYTEMQE